MYTQAWILCSIFIPAAAGLLFLVLPAKKMEEKKMSRAAVAALALTVVSVALLLVSYGSGKMCIRDRHKGGPEADRVQKEAKGGWQQKVFY